MGRLLFPAIFSKITQEIELSQSKFDYDRQFSASSVLAVSQAVRRQFAPVAKKNRRPALLPGRQLLLDISRDISQRYSIKRYRRLYPAEKNCVLMCRDLHHLHVYWRDSAITSTAATGQWIVRVTSRFDSEREPVAYFYRPSPQQLQKQRMSIAIPGQMIGALHQLSVGRFDKENRFQPRLESNREGLQIKRLKIDDPAGKTLVRQSGNGFYR